MVALIPILTRLRCSLSKSISSNNLGNSLAYSIGNRKLISELIFEFNLVVSYNI